MSTLKSFILLSIMLCATNSFAFDDWSKQDVAMQVTYSIVHIIDWGQTRDISRHKNQTEFDSLPSNEARQKYLAEYGSKTYTEINPILGKRPSILKVDSYMATTLVLNAVVTHVLPSDYRPYWQGLGIAFEVWVVGSNYNLGLKMNW
jgi:hypothetical protein